LQFGDQIGENRVFFHNSTIMYDTHYCQEQSIPDRKKKLTGPPFSGTMRLWWRRRGITEGNNPE
ncbi:MAG: hypothetical protein LIR47_02250, partial [Spirochaetota bacterium]|nr:hypothetical protein [Spirochaetota bacterium]